MIIDPLNSNIGYRLGRLFATLEKIDIEANPGVEHTLHRIHYGEALSRPSSTFAGLIDTAKGQLSKIKDAELGGKLGKLLAYLSEDIRAIPLILSPSDQSMFMAGHTKQNQNFDSGIFD
jgi:CRISPR-associated protein Csd1